uniref:RECQ4A n=1 Tax=Arundo donax TaxID=35708 RepID=A0A0A9GBX3_ARUDO
MYIHEAIFQELLLMKLIV